MPEDNSANGRNYTGYDCHRRFLDNLNINVCVLFLLRGWLGGLLVERRTSVSQIPGPGHCRVKTLGKFLTPSCDVVLYNIM